MLSPRINRLFRQGKLVLEAWQGESRNIEAAKKAFYHRASCNGAARSGSYNEAMEKEVA